MADLVGSLSPVPVCLQSASDNVFHIRSKPQRLDVHNVAEGKRLPIQEEIL